MREGGAHGCDWNVCRESGGGVAAGEPEAAFGGGEAFDGVAEGGGMEGGEVGGEEVAEGGGVPFSALAEHPADGFVHEVVGVG